MKTIIKHRKFKQHTYKVIADIIEQGLIIVKSQIEWVRLNRQPKPMFKNGSNHANSKGFACVGEKGEEIIIDKHGNKLVCKSNFSFDTPPPPMVYCKHERIEPSPPDIIGMMMKELSEDLDNKILKEVQEEAAKLLPTDYDCIAAMTKQVENYLNKTK
jgi:hypothetical protein